MSRTSFLWVAALTVGVVSLAANAQTTPISYGGSIMENFDSIGPAGTALPAGWRAGNLTNAASRVDPPTSGYDSDVLYINDGTLANNARAYSFGTAGSSDRAIGFIPTTSSYGDAGLQVALTNDTGKPIATIVLTYTGEQWRVCQGTSTSGAEKLRVYIGTTPNFQAGTFEKLPASFEFTVLKNTPANTALDGNDPANRVEKIGGEYTLAVPIPVGATFYISWHDWNDNGTTDSPISVDDVQIGPPTAATAPVPGDAAFVAVSQGTLSWTLPEPGFPGETITCDVFFGTDPNLIPGLNGSVQIENNLAGNSTSMFPKPLQPETTYYWRVDCTDPNNGQAIVTRGARWSFNTLVVPAVFVVESDDSTEVNEKGPASDGYTVRLNAAPTGNVTVTLDASIDMRAVEEAEEHLADNSMDITSSDLEMPWEDPDTDRQLTAIRYDGVSIPRGVDIANAVIQFTVDEATTGAVKLLIQGELSPDAATIPGNSRSISSRLRTAAAVEWNPPDWPTVAATGPDQATPNLAAIVKEIVAQPDWRKNNAMVFIIDEADVATPSTNKRVAATAPAIRITLTAGNADIIIQPTVLTFTPANAQTPQTVTVTAVDDEASEADPHVVIIQHIVASSDPGYNGLSAPNVRVSIRENDCGAWKTAPMDLNGDCVVNLEDLAMFAARYMSCSRPQDPTCADFR